LHRLALYHDEVHRSCCKFRALTHEDTGGIVAAATTSLPESFGGNRPDYRVWLQDASLTLNVCCSNTDFATRRVPGAAGCSRAVAGDPVHVQIMYGCPGERRLTE
jgi:hypothetical protein